MLANERQDMICSLLRQNGTVTTAELVERFAVSIETIRKDLLSLEQRGLLLRVHGGAVAKGNMKPFAALQQRNRQNGAQKCALAAKAMAFLSEGDIIGIDAGSTAITFAETLKKSFSRMTVVTHSLDVFEILRDHAEFSVILCGGQYKRTENAFYGALTLDMLGSLHLGKAFLFPSAVSLEYGICDYDDDLYLIQRQMMRSSDEIYILADSSKFEKKALLRLDEMRREYRYVTDGGLPDGLKTLYRENNMEIFIGGGKE